MELIGAPGGGPRLTADPARLAKWSPDHLDRSVRDSGDTDSRGMQRRRACAASTAPSRSCDRTHLPSPSANISRQSDVWRTTVPARARTLNSDDPLARLARACGQPNRPRDEPYRTIVCIRDADRPSVECVQTRLAERKAPRPASLHWPPEPSGGGYLPIPTQA